MPEAGSEIARTRFVGELNDVQRRRLIITCKYIDKPALRYRTRSPFAGIGVSISALCGGHHSCAGAGDRRPYSPSSVSTVESLGLAAHEAGIAGDSSHAFDQS
jgi:hypothetical protein